MAAVSTRSDFPEFLPVGTHEVFGVRDAVTSGMDLIARIAEAAAHVCNT